MVLVSVALMLVACGDDDSSVGGEPIVFGAEGNRLRAYAIDEPSRQQVVIASASDDPVAGRDINGQICFAAGGRRFIAGEDTGQPDPPPGWGLFELSGSMVGELSALQIGKLNTTFQGGPAGAEPYGCGFLSDGRLITTDVGNQADGPPSGQVIIWFPPLDVPNPRFCKLDVGLGTAGAVFVGDGDVVYISSARETNGVVRYLPPFPASDDAAGGCGRTDTTGAPLVSQDAVHREQFIAADENIPTPNAVVGTADGTFLVTSVLNGVIAEYDADGMFVRRILEPPAGEVLGPEPFSTGTPLGIGIDSEGAVYYADIGLVIDPPNVGPGRNTGSMRRIRFADGEPLPPETFRDGLAFPDGIGVMEP
jgi:hypothetical protein